MASRFLPSHAKGSMGETMIYKVFWPPFENPFLRPLAQLFYFGLAAPWFIGWWGPSRYLRMVHFFVVKGQTFELDYKAILAPLHCKGVLHVGANVGQEAKTYSATGQELVSLISGASLPGVGCGEGAVG